jgi:preprotein translocase subunit SecE
METQHQKWVNLSYLAVAALLAYIVFAGGLGLAAQFDWEAKVRNIDLVLRIGSIVAGGALFLALYTNHRSNQFMNEVVTELARVTWPTQKETTSATFIVIIMVLISGAILGFLDYLWTVLLQWVL